MTYLQSFTSISTARGSKPRAKRIVAWVSARLGVPVSKICGGSRKRPILLARRLAINLIWRHPETRHLPMTVIARVAGVRDHTTIRHAVIQASGTARFKRDCALRREAAFAATRLCAEHERQRIKASMAAVIERRLARAEKKRLAREERLRLKRDHDISVFQILFISKQKRALVAEKFGYQPYSLDEPVKRVIRRAIAGDPDAEKVVCKAARKPMPAAAVFFGIRYPSLGRIGQSS